MRLPLAIVATLFLAAAGVAADDPTTKAELTEAIAKAKEKLATAKKEVAALKADTDIGSAATKYAKLQDQAKQLRAKQVEIEEALTKGGTAALTRLADQVDEALEKAEQDAAKILADPKTAKHKEKLEKLMFGVHSMEVAERQITDYTKRLKTAPK